MSLALLAYVVGAEKGWKERLMSAKREAQAVHFFRLTDIIRAILAA